MKTVEEVIEKIRVEAGLKRLEFGCKVIMPHNVDGDYDVICSNYYGEKPSFGLSLRGNKAFFPEDVVEILGLEPQLNDLLRVIGTSKVGIDGTGSMVFMETYGNRIRQTADYDLTKSVRQNLTDNKELLELVISLIY